MQIGLDIGSTTIKIAVLDDAGKLLFAKYQRHYSQIAEKIQELLQELFAQFPLLKSARLAVSGSAGLGIAESCGLQFVQEVFAEKVCTERLNLVRMWLLNWVARMRKFYFWAGILTHV